MKPALLYLVLLLATCLPTSQAQAARVLHLASEHQESPWTSGISSGIQSIISRHPDISFKTIYMDAKRKPDKERLRALALEIKQEIDAWQPDLIIISDDPAAQYVITPYFMDGTIPVVFCGIERDASSYNFPAAKITGMVETPPVELLIKELKKISGGERIALLNADDPSTRKEAKYLEETYNIKIEKQFVKTFDEWQTQFLKLQKSADILLLGYAAAISDWNANQATHITNEQTSIPTGSWDRPMARYSLLTLEKLAEEQGEWAATTALKILAGTPVAEIPTTRNQDVNVVLNTLLAQQMGYSLSSELMEVAHFISPVKPKVFYVNSYKKGFPWGDGIEAGLFMALNLTELEDGSIDSSASTIDFTLARLDSNTYRTEDAKHEICAKLAQEIEAWHPDLLIVSDNDAYEYLALTHFNDSEIPVIFCGVSAGDEKPPTPRNMTGMFEVEPVKEALALLNTMTDKKRLGILGSASPVNINILRQIAEHAQVTSSALVTNFAQWKDEYQRLQQETDMLLLLSPLRIADWDRTQALKLVGEQTQIPSATFHWTAMPYALLGHLKSAEELGWWSGQTALRIINGEPTQNIQITENQLAQRYLNMQLANERGITFPVDLLETSIFYTEEKAQP
jgi:ABC-type uncharacterized transport system substrate-binding protein